MYSFEGSEDNVNQLLKAFDGGDNQKLSFANSDEDPHFTITFMEMVFLENFSGEIAGSNRDGTTAHIKFYAGNSLESEQVNKLQYSHLTLHASDCIVASR